jgi:hypothetical protein
MRCSRQALAPQGNPGAGAIGHRGRSAGVRNILEADPAAKSAEYAEYAVSNGWQSDERCSRFRA